MEYDRNDNGDVPVTFGITDTAREKADRFLGERWLRYELNRMVTEYPTCADQELYRMDATPEFHLVFPMESYSIVFIDKIDHLVVVTQMHDHHDYKSWSLARYIDNERWEKRYGNRVPSEGADEKQRLRLRLVPEEENMNRITSATAGEITSAKYRT